MAVWVWVVRALNGVDPEQVDGDWKIFVMDADGSNQTRLTFNNDDSQPTWFPIPAD